MPLTDDREFSVGQTVYLRNEPAVIRQVGVSGSGSPKYYCDVGGTPLPMWVPGQQLNREASPGGVQASYVRRSPHMLAVDGFYQDPDAIRALALEQDFETDIRFFKGKRSAGRHLWPYLREEFERLLGRRITDWLTQPYNGVFQITGYDDPLVWHTDTQSYAAAIYLTPNAPLSAGTSFWRDRRFGTRRWTTHPLEREQFKTDEEMHAAASEIWTEKNLLSPEGWELVDRMGAVYNRLVIWDAKLIHSASSYEGLSRETPDQARLVQLFFFSIEP